MSTLYKAVRPDGTDFRTGTVRWTASERPVTRARTVQHPSSREAVRGDHSTSLAVSTTPWSLPGSPSDHRRMRLLTVEPVEGVPVIETDATKRQSVSWRVTGEIESWHRYGPRGHLVARVVEQASNLTSEQVSALVTALVTAWVTARDAAWVTAWYAAGDAAVALCVSDLVGQHGLTQDHIDTLLGPWVEVMGDPRDPNEGDDR